MIEERKVRQKIYYMNDNRDRWVMVTEWECGEGFDIELRDSGDIQRFSLHINHFDIMKFLIDGWHIFKQLEKK